MPRQFETPMESALKDLFNYLLFVIRRVSFSRRILSHVSLSKQLLPLRIAERNFRVMQVVLNLFIKPAHVDALPEFRIAFEARAMTYTMAAVSDYPLRFTKGWNVVTSTFAHILKCG